MKSALKILLCLMCLFSFATAREDMRTYTGNVDTLAVWINPKSIKVYIQESNKSHILKNAFKTWDSAMRNNMNFVFVNNQNEADIWAGYIDKLDGNKAGITKSSHITIQGKIYMHKAQVYISKTNPVGFNHNDAELLKITLHEIGHAIGILGHSSSINDIMYPTTASTKNTSPSLRDIDTVNKLYGF